MLSEVRIHLDGRTGPACLFGVMVDGKEVERVDQKFYRVTRL